jgi:type IV pilus assembly protein PilE
VRSTAFARPSTSGRPALIGGWGLASSRLRFLRKQDEEQGMDNSARARGFTLIEVIITMAIVAIMVAVALPTYRDHVRKSRRAEAQAYLMAVASRQQQFLLDTRGYADSLARIALPVPASVAAAYDLGIAAAGGPPPTFRISATPKATTDQTYERCGTLAIDQTGAKSAALGTCW